MQIGDIVLLDTSPPHLASVTDGGRVVCEDGTCCPLDSRASLLVPALEVIKELEKGVLGYGKTWRLRDNP